jgi:predicted AlkP superfamily phosphohydrolase/phosphomutase
MQIFLFLCIIAVLPITSGFHIPWSKVMTTRTSRISVLDPKSESLIKELKIEINRLKTLKNDSNWPQNVTEKEEEEIETKLKKFESVIRAVDTLEEIEQDIEMCKVNLRSDDEYRKDRAASFLKEFETLRDNIENQVNKVLVTLL